MYINTGSRFYGGFGRARLEDSCSLAVKEINNDSWRWIGAQTNRQTELSRRLGRQVHLYKENAIERETRKR